jgi:ankyrin repeat protein
MASLKDLTTTAEVRRAIKNLRQESDSYRIAYETAIQRIQGQSVSRTKLANRVLAWIVYAKRVLKASELRLVLGVEVGKRKLDYDFCPDVDMMVSVCAGLVTIDEKADTIRLVHYTAQTFFDNAKSTILPSAETEIAKICITYLSLKIFARPQYSDGYQSDSPSEGEEDEEPIEQYLSDFNQGSVIYEYAAQYWGVHAREAPDAHGDVMKFLSRRSYITRAYKAATKIYGYEYRESSLVSVDALHLAAIFGLEEAVEQILHARLSNPDVVIDLIHWSDHTDGTEFYLTPLTIAASQNHPAIVKILLEFGATLGAVSLDERKNYKGITALNVASRKGFEVIVDMLLRADAKIHSQKSMEDVKDSQTGRHEQPTKPTLCIGPQKSHDELERLLQQTPRPIVDLPGRYGWSSLLIASREGHDKIVDMLLRHGANVNFQPERQNIEDTPSRLLISPLFIAAFNGNTEIVKMLLQKGAEANGPCHGSRSPLHGAASNGHTEITKMLLQKGADVNAPYHGSRSPLHDAASNGHTEIVKLLLHFGSKINPHNDQSSSYLYGASEGGHVEMVKMLLELGANTHLKKTALYSPIHAAIIKRRFEVFDLLISSGADPNQRQKLCTPLQMARRMYIEEEPNGLGLGHTMMERLTEAGGMPSFEFNKQEILELMRERHEENASSAGQQQLVALPKEHP